MSADEQNTQHTDAPVGESNSWIRDDEYAAARETAWQSAVEALTSAARLHNRTARAGEYVGAGRQLDFAEFVTGVLAAVAANIGSVDQLLAGRPGSWEADKVGDLLRSTVGYDEEYLVGHRTEPVTLHLNVDRLMEETYPQFQSPYWREREALEARYDDLVDLETGEGEEAYIALEDAIRPRWEATYTRWAEAFTTAVHAEAATILELRVPVTITVVTDPEQADDGPVHPDEWSDLLVLRLWEAGAAAIRHDQTQDQDQDRGDSPS